MARYSVNGELAAVSTSYKTAMRVSAPASSMRRIKVYDLMLEQGGTPADNACYWDISRHTAVPTDTSVTPNPLDGADAASAAVAGSNATAEGTVTSNSAVFGPIAINQRLTFRWVASDKSELVIPATANNGLSFRTKSALYTGVAGGSFLFEE